MLTVYNAFDAGVGRLPVLGIIEHLAWCCTSARGVEKNTTRGAWASVGVEREHLARGKKRWVAK